MRLLLWRLAWVLAGVMLAVLEVASGSGWALGISVWGVVFVSNVSFRWPLVLGWITGHLLWDFIPVEWNIWRFAIAMGLILIGLRSVVTTRTWYGSVLIAVVLDAWLWIGRESLFWMQGKPVFLWDALGEWGADLRWVIFWTGGIFLVAEWARTRRRQLRIGKSYVR